MKEQVNTSSQVANEEATVGETKAPVRPRTSRPKRKASRVPAHQNRANARLREKRAAEGKDPIAPKNMFKDLDAMEQNARQLIAHAANNVEVYKMAQARNFEGVDRERLEAAMKLLNRDLLEANKELDGISAEVSKTRKELNPEDVNSVVFMIQLGELYQAWTEKFGQVIQPILIDIAESTKVIEPEAPANA